MKIIFRVDASVLIGSGHVMRTLVLAKELKRKGHDITFACTPLKGDMREFITENGFRINTLEKPIKEQTPINDTDYVAWLQKSIYEDAIDFIKNIKSADLVITDHYAIDSEWQQIVRTTLDCKLVAIDDLARDHEADLIIDQTLGRRESDYFSANARLLIGSDYALLRGDFLNRREEAISRSFSSDIPKVLISMGGVDAPNATLKVLQSLVCNIDAEFTVLLSKRSPHFEQVRDWSKLYSNVTHKEFVLDMANIMLEHDIAIGAPGTTSWERACMGLPNIIIPLADNQKLISDQLVKHGASLKIELNDLSSNLHSEFLRLIRGWSTYKNANLSLCDGRGLYRVVLAIDSLFNGENLYLEKACADDVLIVYDWQLHPNTRKYALNSDSPTWEEHNSWMLKKLNSSLDYFYMIVDRDNKTKLGVVRLDWMQQGNYLLSVFIDPENYGKGIASKALSLVDSIHPDVTIHATVLKQNTASQQLFKNACYQQIDEETYIRSPIH